jgi:concentrative nucleoside transporter, CNT family
MNPQGLLGAAGLIALAWALSEDRRKPPLRLVGAGLALQVILALVLLKLPGVKDAVLELNAVVQALDKATRAGTGFVFGYVGGGAAPFKVTQAGATFVLAFQALPLILVMSALSALLFHWRILPVIVNGFSWALGRTLGIGGALGVGAAANVFVGMVESPLLVRPYVARMSRGELFALMVCGMATLAGTVLVLYSVILGPVVPGALGHILSASLINVPGALLIAGLMVPPGEVSTEGGLAPEREAKSSIDAIVNGTTRGLALVLNVTAMLIVLVALVALANMILGLFPDYAGAPLTLERILGWVFAPLAWAIGVSWNEAATAGALLGKKVVLNELLAYIDLAKLGPDALSERSRLIMVYALCGFANLGSLGIMLGGLGTLAPERRGEIVALGLKSVLAGVMTTALTAAIVGLMI